MASAVLPVPGAVPATRIPKKVLQAIAVHAVCGAAGKSLLETRTLLHSQHSCFKPQSATQYADEASYACFYIDERCSMKLRRKLFDNFVDVFDPEDPWLCYFCAHLGTSVEAVRAYWSEKKKRSQDATSAPAPPPAAEKKRARDEQEGEEESGKREKSEAPLQAVVKKEKEEADEPVEESRDNAPPPPPPPPAAAVTNVPRAVAAQPPLPSASSLLGVSYDHVMDKTDADRYYELMDESKPATESSLVLKLLSMVRPLELAALCRCLASDLDKYGSRNQLLMSLLDQLQLSGSPLFNVWLVMPAWVKASRSITWGGKAVPESIYFVSEPHPVLSITRRLTGLDAITKSWNAGLAEKQCSFAGDDAFVAPGPVGDGFAASSPRSGRPVANPRPRDGGNVRKEVDALLESFPQHSLMFVHEVFLACGRNSNLACDVLSLSNDGARKLVIPVCTNCQSINDHDTRNCKSKSRKVDDEDGEAPDEPASDSASPPVKRRRYVVRGWTKDRAMKAELIKRSREQSTAERGGDRQSVSQVPGLEPTAAAAIEMDENDDGGHEGREDDDGPVELLPFDP